MTANQINYQKYLEDQRTHMRNEELTQSRDRETQRSNRAREVETNRANLAREQETYRNNRATEAETNRSNLAREIETNRANLAREGETNRANLETERIKEKGIDVESEDSRYGADVGYRGRVDSAYINKWGINPTDVANTGKAIVQAATSPQVADTLVTLEKKGFFQNPIKTAAAAGAALTKTKLKEDIKHVKKRKQIRQPSPRRF